MFDETNGDCVHVDLNMLFDIGSGLNVPEVVPFRLTQNLVDAMGVLGYAGTFTVTCDITMAVLLQNKDALTSVFQTLGNVWIFKSDVSREALFQKIRVTLLIKVISTHRTRTDGIVKGFKMKRNLRMQWKKNLN